MPNSSEVLESYLDTICAKMPVSDFQELIAQFDYKKLVAHNKKLRGNLSGISLLPSLEAHSGIIEDSNGSMIPHEIMAPFMTPENRNRLIWDLQVTNMLLLAQRDYEEKHQKKGNLKRYKQLSERCEELIKLLNAYNSEKMDNLTRVRRRYAKWIKQNQQDVSILLSKNTLLARRKELRNAWLILLASPNHKDEKKQAEELIKQIDRKLLRQTPEQGRFCDGMPVKYLALLIPRLFTHTIKTLVDFMSAINEKRLYWVWGGGFVKILLEDTFIHDFFHSDASSAAYAPDPYTGSLSWGLYYLRLGFNLFNFGKHFIKCSWWMSPEELSIDSWEERTEWNRRKYAIYNDIFWATANLLCFFWLGVMKMAQEGLLSYFIIGDILTVFLLIFDAKMALMDSSEQEAAHKEEMDKFSSDIVRLEMDIKALRLANAPPEQIELLVHRNADLLKQEKQCEKDWSFRKVHILNNSAYAIGLFVAFTIVATGGASGAVILAGTILCFVFTVLNNFIKKGIELHKMRSSHQEIIDECTEKVSAFIKCFDSPDYTENEKKLLYLEVKGLMAETEYQRKKVLSQTLQVIGSVIGEALLIPAMILCFPFGAGYAMIAAVALINKIIDCIINPEKEPMTPFDEKEYNSFVPMAQAWLQRMHPSRPGFFSGRRTENRTDSDSEGMSLRACQ